MKFRREAQIVFQDPGSSLNPYQDVRSILSLPLKVHKVVPKNEIDDKILEILEMVELPADFMYKSPNSIGGGEKQLVSIARALCCNPKFIILDEPTSSLDVSIQAQVLNLLQDLQEKRGLTYMFITHNLSVVRHISDQICVMYLGQIVEMCTTKELFTRPLHPYTKALFSAIPSTDIHSPHKPEILEGELSSPINPKPGCRFAARCKYANEACLQPQSQEEISPGHIVRCCRVREIN